MEKQRNDRFWMLAGLILLVSIFIFSLLQAYKLYQSDHADLVKVSLKFNIDNANEVRIAGSFNNWQARCCLEKVGSNEWSIQLQLVPGVYEYVLVVDGEHWVPKQVLGKLKDGLGGQNGVLYVNKTTVRQGGGNV